MSPLIQEDVQFFSGNARVSGWFYKPDSGSGPWPGLVFCPGYTGTKYAAFYQPYMERLTAAGLAVLLIDYRGWGDSEGERGLILPLEQAADIRNALTYLQTRAEISPNRLGLMGVSFGGAHVSYVAGVDQRVKCAVSVSGIADGEAWLRSMRREYEWQEFLAALAADARERVLTSRSRIVNPTEDIMIPTPERRNTRVKGNVPADKVPRETPLYCAEAIMAYKPIDVVARIAPRAMLWFYVEEDAVVPSEHSQAMYAAAGSPKKLVRLPGQSHYGAYLEHLNTIMEHTLAWYAAHL